MLKELRKVENVQTQSARKINQMRNKLKNYGKNGGADNEEIKEKGKKSLQKAEE